MSKQKEKDEIESTPPVTVDLNPNDEEPKSPSEEKSEAKQRGKPKEYSIDTFKDPLSKDEEKEFNKLDKEEQRKFIIRKWTVENNVLDKKDQHEISYEDQKLIGQIQS